MKKKMLVKFAALMVVATNTITTFAKLPTSALLFGEVKEPIERP